MIQENDVFAYVFTTIEQDCIRKNLPNKKSDLIPTE